METGPAATEKQRELFEHAAGFNPNETDSSLRIDHEHGVAFAVGMFQMLGIEIVETTHEGRLFHVRLSESVQQELGIGRSRYEVTLDRELVVNRPNTHMLDLDSFLMQYLLKKAKSYDFMGLSAVIKDQSLGQGALLTSLLRWQNDQGNRMRQEYTAYQVTPDGDVHVNPDAFADWLKTQGVTGRLNPDRRENQELFKQAERAADSRFKEVGNMNLHPENNQWISGGWLAE